MAAKQVFSPAAVVQGAKIDVVTAPPAALFRDTAFAALEMLHPPIGELSFQSGGLLPEMCSSSFLCFGVLETEADTNGFMAPSPYKTAAHLDLAPLWRRAES